MKDSDFLLDIKDVLILPSGLGSVIFKMLNKMRQFAIHSDTRAKYDRKSLLIMMIAMKLVEIKSISSMLSSDLKRVLPMGKDVFYCFLNNIYVDWRSIQCLQVLDLLKSSPQTKIPVSKLPAKEVPCLIIDDTSIEKTGKRIEGITRIYSYLGKKYSLGYKCLNLCLWTGKNLLHLDFSLHCEQGKNKTGGLTEIERKNQFSKLRVKSCASYKRIQELTKSKSASALAMLKRLSTKKLNVKYLLADAWFFSEAFLKGCTAKEIHLISRPRNRTLNFTINKEKCKFNNIVQRYKSQKIRSRKFNFFYFSIIAEYKGIPIKLFFYQERTANAKWEAIVSTQTTLNEIRVWQLYQNRWAIEVSYKELKQDLKFGSCQSLDFNAQIADVTQTLLAYNLLSTIKSKNNYQSLGALFDDIGQHKISKTIMDKFWEFIISGLRKIAETLNIQLQKIKDLFLEKAEFFTKFFKFSELLTTET